MAWKVILWWGIISCWVLGGQTKGRYRDIPAPILLGLGIWWATKSWLVGLASVITYQIIRLGYGNYDPENDPKPSFLARLTHDRQGWYIRALWGLIVSVVGCGALYALKFLPLPHYITYIVGNTLINYSVSRFRVPVILCDILVAGGIGSVIFLV
jgi:hypothetical protein